MSTDFGITHVQTTGNWKHRGDYPTSAAPLGDGIQLTAPDWTFSDDFSGVKDTSIYTKSTFTTYGYNDGGNTVLSANYAPEGIIEANHADSEVELELPIDAVQVLVKFREYVPTTYTSANCNNHKSVGFWSGEYGMVYANIAVTSECWPEANNGTPSISVGNDGVNYGQHFLPNDSGAPLWIAGDGNWHHTVALLTLAEDAQSYGRYRIWRDGVLIVDSENSDYRGYMPEVPVRETLHYSTRGNFIDTVRLFGWCNVNDDSSPAFAGTMHFLYDDLEIQANTTHKAIIGV